MSTTASGNLRRMVTDKVYTYVEGDYPPEVLISEIVDICGSVHQNAVGYGQLLGEERVLDAVIGGASKASLNHWWAEVTAKITEAQS